MIEVEIKIRIEPDKARESLIKNGFIGSDHVKETDIYFDNKNQDIRLNDNALRIRTIIWPDSDKTQRLITFKGKRSDCSSMTRPEFETAIDSDTCMTKIFNALGYHSVSPSVIKERILFRKDNINACLDKVDGLGYFLELETISDEADKDKALSKLWNTLTALGYSPKDSITTSYLSMLQAMENT
ncbi:MAG: class IV adenylate cyclase [Lachnospiraceae bacterium]|nr:class IV adenylate cyclase [Lachnospiraceae bacterium]